VSPEPEINITHNTCTLWHLLLFAIRFSVKIGKAISLQRMANPVAKASLRHLPIRFSELAKPVANAPHLPNSIYHWGKVVLKSVVCNIDTRSPFAAPTSRGLPRTASAPHKGWARF